MRIRLQKETEIVWSEGGGGLNLRHGTMGEVDAFGPEAHWPSSIFV